MPKMPKGHINQHKRLATGQSLQTCDKRDLDPNGWGKGERSYDGRTNISSGTTGSVGTTNRVPPSNTAPDAKGPRGHSVPKSTMTPA